jgi:hypothetical protein
VQAAQRPSHVTSQLHDALVAQPPALEKLPGKHLRRRGVLELLRAGTLAQLRELGDTTCDG